MRDYRYLPLFIALSNIIGALVVFAYFAYVDLDTFLANKAFWRGSDADWTSFWIAMGIVSVIIFLFSYYLMRPLQKWEQLLRSGSEKTAPKEVQRRAAMYPLEMALATLVLWILVGLFFGQGGQMIGSASAKTFWRTFLGVGIIGGVTISMLVFLLGDAIWRAHLPLFYPNGRISDSGAWRISAGQRLIATFILTGLVPLLTLAVIAPNQAVSAADIDSLDLFNRLKFTILYVVIAGVVSNMLLGYLTARSLLRPLLRLTSAMDQVGGGDLAVRLPVESNDELGDLADDFNQMLAALTRGQQMRDLFGRYVSKEVAEQVLERGADLGGENIMATALFADIRDFTGLSERLPAQQVVDILNRYYTRMVDVIVAEGGLVNKFGGDSLLAVFGAPIRQSDHALRAVRAAWQMNRALAEFNAEQISLGMPPLTIGVGISSGEMVAGNIGGETRLEYTVIGDPVNVASRLESLTKETGEMVLLSQQTQAFLEEKDQDQVERFKEMLIRGKKNATWVYKLTGMRTD